MFQHIRPPFYLSGSELDLAGNTAWVKLASKDTDHTTSIGVARVTSLGGGGARQGGTGQGNKSRSRGKIGPRG